MGILNRGEDRINIAERLLQKRHIRKTLIRIKDKADLEKEVEGLVNGVSVTNAEEVEAQIASMVSHMVANKTARKAYRYSNFYTYREKLKIRVDILEKGIREEEKLLSSEVDRKKRREIRMKKRSMKKLLREYKIRLDLIPQIVRETKEIARSIRVGYAFRNAA